MKIPLEELQIESWPPIEKGGQHTNGPEHRGVKLTHIPTGAIVASTTERSQYKNREKALLLMELLLYP